MTEAPEKIWATGWFLDPTCRWWSDKRLGENAAQTEFRRADLCADPALLAEAVEVLRFYADEENYRGRSITDPCGCCSSWYEPKIHIDGEDSGDRARAFIAKLEARHDR